MTIKQFNKVNVSTKTSYVIFPDNELNSNPLDYFTLDYINQDRDKFTENYCRLQKYEKAVVKFISPLGDHALSVTAYMKER